MIPFFTSERNRLILGTLLLFVPNQIRLSEMYSFRRSFVSLQQQFLGGNKTLPEGVEVTHINLNDGTCAGMVWPEKRAMAIQYHPEASPGPHDSDVCFEQFMDMIRKEKQGNGSYTSADTAAQHVNASA